MAKKLALTAMLPLLLALAVPGAFAQSAATGRLEGRVYDPITDQFLRNAEISVAGTATLVRSEEWGYYRIDNLPAGTVNISVAYAGREARAYKVEITPGATLQMELEIGVPISAPAAPPAPPAPTGPTAPAAPATGPTTLKDDDIIVLDKFVVSAELEGNAKAIMEQRAAMNMKSVVASDAFGDIAEGNMTEFLQFLPGVIINFVDDEGRGVSIRGMDEMYATVTQDGVRLPGSSSTTNGDMRSPSFEQMNIANADVIEVNKMLTADLDADAPAGNVNIRTASPLDRKRMRLVAQFGVTANSALLTMGRTQFGDEWLKAVRPGGSIEFSNNFFGRKLGVHFSASISDYLSNGESMNLIYYPGGSGREPPWLYAITMQELKQLRRRSAAALNLDWQATSALRISLKTTWADSWRQCRTYELNFGSASGNATCPWPYTYFRVKDGTGTVNYGGFNFVKNDIISTIMPGFTYKGRTITIDGQFAYARATTDYTDLSNGYFGRVEMGVSGLTFGAVRSHPSSTAWNILVDRNLEDPSLYSMRNRNGTSTIASRPYDMGKHLYSGKLDFKWIAPWNTPLFIKTGLSYRKTIHDERRPYQYWTYLGPDGVASTGDEHFADKVSTFSFDKMLRHFGVGVHGPDGPMSIPVPDKSAFARELELFPERFGNRTDDEQLNRVYKARDHVPAAYVMGNVKLGRLQCQAGLRFESYNIRLMLPFYNPELEEKPDTPRLNYGEWVWGKNTYNNVFASGSARWNFSRNTMLRAGFAQSVLYPTINRLRTFVTEEDMHLSPEQVDLMGNQMGNWNLKPEKATDYSVELEHYSKKWGTFLFSAYYKDIKDVHYQYWYSLDAGDTYRRQWRNYAKYDYPGIEIEYGHSLSRFKSLPRCLRNVNMRVFYARNFLQKKNEIVQAGTTPHSAGGGLNYRWKRFYASLSGIYISERFYSMREASTPDKVTGDMYVSHVAEVQRRYARLHFNLDVRYDLSYKGSRGSTSLVLAGRNIFKEPDRRYSNNPAYLTYISTPYTQWTLSVRTIL